MYDHFTDVKQGLDAAVGDREVIADWYIMFWAFLLGLQVIREINMDSYQ